MNERVLITDEELHAFIDGELDPLRAADVAVLLQYHAELRAKVAAFRADKAMIATAYGPLADQPVPAKLQAMIARSRAAQRTTVSRRAIFAMAASVAGVAVIGWQAYVRLQPDDEGALIRAALAARSTGTNVASNRADADRILQATLGLPVKTPDMTKFGFTFARYRLAGSKAVALDYQDDAQRVFTLYLRPSTGEEHFDMTKQGAVRICVWQDEVLSAVMLAEVNAGEMLRLATLAYAGLSA